MKQTFTITIEKEVPAPNEDVAQVLANSLAKQIGGEVSTIYDNLKLPFE